MASQITEITDGLESISGLIVPELGITKTPGSWINWTLATVVAQWWSAEDVLLFEAVKDDRLTVAVDAITLSPAANPIESDIARNGTVAKYATWGDIGEETARFRLTILEAGNKDATVEINATWHFRAENYVGAGLTPVSVVLTVEVGGVDVALTITTSGFTFNSVNSLAAKATLDDELDLIPGADVSTSKLFNMTFAILFNYIKDRAEVLKNKTFKLLDNTFTGTKAEFDIAVTDGNFLYTGDVPTAHAASHTDGSDDLQDATASVKGLATAAQVTKLDAIEALADVTDAANVNAAGAVVETDYNGQSVLLAITDNTPLTVVVGASQFVGRKAAGDLGVLSVAETLAVLGVEAGATADQSAAEIKTAYESNADTNAFDDAEQTKLVSIADGANNYSHPNHSGDVTSVGDGAQTIANNAVTNAKAADMAANTVKLRAAGTSGDPSDVAVAASEFVGRKATGDLGTLSVAEVLTLLDVFADGGDARGADRKFGNTDGFDLALLVNNVAVLNLQTGAPANSLYVNSTGVGIGTGAPAVPFHLYVNSTATQLLRIEQDGAGDAAINFVLSGVRNWTIGIDNSDVDKFKIAQASDLGTTDRLVIDINGRAGFGAAAPAGQLHVDQSNASGAIPVLYLDQADVSEEIFEIVSVAGEGDAIEAVGAKALTTTLFIKCTINGVTVYLQAGTIA